MNFKHLTYSTSEENQKIILKVACDFPMRLIDTPISEAVELAQKIYKYFGQKKLKLCMSNGVDSQAMLEAFVKAEVPIEILCFVYEDGLNDFDVNSVSKFCSEVDVVLKFIKFDVMQFLGSNEYWQLVHQFGVSSPCMLAHMKICESISGPLIFSGNPPINQNLLGQPEASLPDYNHLKFNEYLDEKGCAFFFAGCSELVYSFLNLSKTKDLLNLDILNGLIAPLSSEGIIGCTDDFQLSVQSLGEKNAMFRKAMYDWKCQIFLEGGFNIKPQANKFTGFERVKLRFSELNGVEAAEFETILRIPAERFSKMPHIQRFFK